MMRLPAMYFFLCGQCLSFIHSGISETASRLRILMRSVLAIVQVQIKVAAYNTTLQADANNEIYGELTQRAQLELASVRLSAAFAETIWKSGRRRNFHLSRLHGYINRNAVLYHWQVVNS